LGVEVLEGPSTQCLALTTGDFAILAFRGTRLESFPDPLATLADFLGQEAPPGREDPVAPDWDDTLTDANIITGPDGVHRGFDDALAQLDEAEPPLRQFLAGLGGRPVWLTGHSLGAALATVAAFRLAPPAAQGLVTFGSPRVGGRGFADAFAEAFPQPCLRFVHGSDIVTEVPPTELLLGYRPVGELRYLSEGGDLLDDPGAAEVALDRAVGQAATALRAAAEAAREFFADPLAALKGLGRPRMLVPFAALADHAPLYYANGVWNAVEQG
jgi:triacylglycerol lipase